MRVKILILINFVFTTLTLLAEEKLPVLKIGADVYSNVTVTVVTTTDIYFTSDKGMANAKLKNLEPAIQKHFHFDAAKADAFEKQQRVADLRYPFQVDINSINPSNAKSVMDDTIIRVKAIINQPVRAYAETSDMNVATYRPGWFHVGAITPDFNHVDIRATQELQYGKNAYVTSDLNRGVVFIGSEVEFNSMTKFFYVDRSLPKKKLTEAEMLEINKLYRIIGRCQGEIAKLGPAASADTMLTNASGETEKMVEIPAPDQSFEAIRKIPRKTRLLYGGIAIGALIVLMIVMRLSKKSAD